jgi:ketosteroid isomerase-like protein
MLDPDVRLIQPQMPVIVGHIGLLEEFARPLFALIPDLHGTVEDWAARGDTAMIAVRLEGTLGGRPFSFRAVDRVTLRDGVATERETYLDPLPLLAAVLTRPRSWPAFARLQALRGKRLLAR